MTVAPSEAWFLAYDSLALARSRPQRSTMLTDIFSTRYASKTLWSALTAKETKLLRQAFEIVRDVYPTKVGTNWPRGSEEAWYEVHELVARELGVKELAFVTNGWSARPIDLVCESFVCEEFKSYAHQPDTFVKDRLSFVELALRLGGEALSKAMLEVKLAALPKSFHNDPDMLAKLDVPDASEWRRQFDQLKARIKTFNAAVSELNVRLQQAGAPLSYHDGFIQISEDGLIEKRIAEPFWKLVAASKWENVSLDMAEALDLRDSGAKDPAYHAAKALESTIKIISGEKGWSTGTENGAANYIDNLVSQKNGRFIEVWEGDLLKDYFKKVRNPMGHGAGSSAMPVLSKEQCNWAIETAMSWTRSLVERI